MLPVPPWPITVFVTDDIIDITVFSQLVISGLKTEKLLIREKEVQAILTEDFKKQFPDGIGHQPAIVFKKYNASLTDRIGIVLDRKLPSLNGSATFKIPVEITYEGSLEPPIEIEVDQVYDLKNGVLSISKSGCKLFEQDIPELYHVRLTSKNKSSRLFFCDWECLKLPAQQAA